jgi:hypothetical protein
VVAPASPVVSPMNVPSLLTTLLPLLAMNPASLATSSPSELQEQASQAGQMAHVLVSPSVHTPGSTPLGPHRGQGRDGEGLMWRVTVCDVCVVCRRRWALSCVVRSQFCHSWAWSGRGHKRPRLSSPRHTPTTPLPSTRYTHILDIGPCFSLLR